MLRYLLFLPRLLKLELYNSCLDSGQLALTYADGPSPYTGNLLETLRDKKVKAAFFFSSDYLDIPYVQSYVKQIKKDGHLIGIVLRDDVQKMNIDDDKTLKNITQLRDKVKKLSGSDVSYIQIPYSPDYPKNLVPKLESMKFVVTSQNLDSEDYKFFKKDKEDVSVSVKKRSAYPQSMKADIVLDPKNDPKSNSMEKTKGVAAHSEDQSSDSELPEGTANNKSSGTHQGSKAEEDNDMIVQQIYRSVETQLNKIVAPAKGAFIMVQHDTIAKSVEASPKIIDLIKSKKYNIIRLDECIGTQGKTKDESSPTKHKDNQISSSYKKEATGLSTKTFLAISIILLLKLVC